MYIQIGVMDRDIHGALRGLNQPATGPAEDAGSGAPAIPGKRQSTQDYRVIVDLPDPLPVTEAELELLEAELADFIAELLKK